MKKYRMLPYRISGIVIFVVLFGGTAAWAVGNGIDPMTMSFQGSAVPNVLKDVDPWTLSSTHTEQLPKDIVGWANAEFTHQSPNLANNPEDVTPLYPLSYVKHIVFAPIHIPRSRHIEGFERKRPPTYYAAFILQDARGDLYSASVYSESYGVNLFHVASFGPVLDVRPGAYSQGFEARRLKTWPHQEMQDRADKEGGKPVLIPYPHALDDFYYQYGSDVKTAQFQDLRSGVVYQGLDEVLNAVEDAWNK